MYLFFLSPSSISFTLSLFLSPFPFSSPPELSDKAGRLALSSKAYRKEARYLNLRSSIAATIAVLVVVFLFFIFLRYWFF